MRRQRGWQGITRLFAYSYTVFRSTRNQLATSCAVMQSCSGLAFLARASRGSGVGNATVSGDSAGAVMAPSAGQAARDGELHHGVVRDLGTERIEERGHHGGLSSERIGGR